MDKFKTISESVEEVCEITDLRVRWVGHRLHAEVNATVDPKLSVTEGHEIGDTIREKLLEDYSYISETTIHVDPLTASGEHFHCRPGELKAKKAVHT